MNMFKFGDYDCIGFDLDSTIIHYNITNLAYLEYDVITDFLIKKKGYSSKLKEPLTDEDLDFLQKGLFFDFEKGNVLKLSVTGNIHNASHGTKFLSTQEIEKYYPNREWEISKIFSKDPLLTWNGPLSLKIRTLLNCFDMVPGLVFAKIVDILDEENGKPLEKYDIWPDILDALTEMYAREQFKNNGGNFFKVLKDDPAKYIYKCDSQTLDLIREIKKTKKTFLITGSNSDFAELTTNYALGKGWESLFDIIICYAKKPGFFTGNKPFYSIKNYYEDKLVSGNELEVGKVYNQGNWTELLQFFSRITSKDNPRCLYVGDNLLQDIYAPSNFANCDTMVISDEQLSEKMLDHNLSHSDQEILNSKVWGSFFTLKDSDGHKDSFWNYIIKKHSKICIPNLNVFCDKPLDVSIKCFDQKDDDKELIGYYPGKPAPLINLK